MTQTLAIFLNFCFMVSCLFMPVARIGNPGVKDVADMFRPIALTETMVVVDPGDWSRDEYNVLVSLQGITARDGKAKIYLAEGNYRKYLKAYKIANPAQVFEDFSGTVWDLVERFKP